MQSTQDTEESVNRELGDLGMLEQGMTFQDKKDLLNVVRLSQKSARAEEEERKTKAWSPKPQYNSINTRGLTSSKEAEDDTCKPKEIDVDEGDINQDIISNLSMAVTDCIREDPTDSKTDENSAPPLEYFGGIGSTSHDSGSDSKAKPCCGNSPDSPITLSSKDSEIGNTSGDPGVLTNGCEIEENNVPQRDCLVSDNENVLEIFPASGKGKLGELNNLKRKKDDKERNIDVFSHSNVTGDHNFIRRTANKNQDRIPFYFVPEGMGLRKYIAYFKCCVNQYYKNLSVIQRNNIEHLEWGAPIRMDVSGFTNFRSNSLDGQCDSASKRYNFRDRYPKPKVIDFASENSEDAEEEESNDEDIFTPHNKKLPGIKLSTKRKNTSANDTMSTKKEKKESPQKKSQEDGESVEDDDQEDNQFGDNPDKNLQKNRGTTTSRKRARKSRSKLLQSQNETSEDLNEIPTVSLTSIIEPDIVIAEGPSIVSTPPQLDDITNQPSPLSVKQRRLQLKTKSNGRLNRRKSEPRKNPDVVIVDEDIKPVEEPVERIRCPICWNSYPATDIEEHASECNQYSPDNNSSVKV